jgi:uncharacterized HAD superfamily protein
MEPKKMVVMFDLDGVLADFYSGYRSVQERMGKTVTTSTVWDDYWDKDVWQEIKNSQFWATLHPLVNEDTFKRINGLNAYADVYFVTSRGGVNVKSQTSAWLQQHGIDSPSVIISSQKGEVAKAINADYSIEDKAGNACYIAYHAPRCRSYLLDGDGIRQDRCNNRFESAVLGRSVKRVENVEGYLQEIENAKR